MRLSAYLYEKTNQMNKLTFHTDQLVYGIMVALVILGIFVLVGIFVIGPLALLFQ